MCAVQELEEMSYLKTLQFFCIFFLYFFIRMLLPCIIMSSFQAKQKLFFIILQTRFHGFLFRLGMIKSSTRKDNEWDGTKSKILANLNFSPDSVHKLLMFENRLRIIDVTVLNTLINIDKHCSKT